jgi:epoxyqueuosine reductase
MDDRIKRILLGCGAAEARSLAYEDIRDDMNPAAQRQAETAVPDAQGLIIAAFPYYAGQSPGNLSLYTRGEDYHRALMRRLDAAITELTALFPDHVFRAFVDVSPIPEKLAARRAGLGIYGRNGLIFVPPYGSYIFLGAILTDLPLEREGNESPLCPDCGFCAEICPSGAIEETDDFGADPKRCLSGVSQRKGELSAKEERLLSAQSTIWGCDLCQLHCPLNEGAERTSLPDFTGDGQVPYLDSLSSDDIAGLDAEQFQNEIRRPCVCLARPRGPPQKPEPFSFGQS